MKKNNMRIIILTVRVSVIATTLCIAALENPLRAQNECKKYLDDINKKDIPIPENKIADYHNCLQKTEAFYALLKNPDLVNGAFPEDVKAVKNNIHVLRKDSVTVKGQVAHYTQKNIPDSIRFFSDRLKTISQSLNENYMTFSKLSDNVRLTLKQSCQKLITYYDEKDNEIKKEEFISRLNKYQ